MYARTYIDATVPVLFSEKSCVPFLASKTADRPVAARVWKSPWLVTVLKAYGGRLAIEATMEPPVTVSRNQRSKIPDDGLGRCRDAAQPPDPIDR